MDIKILKKEDLKSCHEVIIKSFLPVAKALSMTEDNCPNNSAFMKLESLHNMYHKGNEIYGLYEGQLIGCISIEKKASQYNLKLLCVLPSFRNKHYGKKLVEFIEDRVLFLGGRKIVLGMVYENKKLLKWYETLGYVSGKVKNRKCSIVFMTKELK